ncbi:glycosyltransferase family 4 protein [Paenibacillus humicola]|uniref:glycosyltransferase family 4 protein n=1 Tax=Paenibacillus humicola TaxID=3110540 RepID=UPI00237BB9D9|nr:glycosyltransferase family 4 protein [Paenibacillus humicola]
MLIIAPEQIPVPPPVGGSVEHSVYQISRRFPSRHRVTVVSRKRNGLPSRSVYGNLTILRVAAASKKQYIAKVLKKVGGRRFDIVQIDNRPSFVPAVRRAFPKTTISVFLHSMTFVSPPMTSVRKAAAELRLADMIVGNSRSLQRTLSARFPRLRGRIAYVHLGVDLDRFRPSGRRRSSGKGFNVLFAGRLIPRKGLPVLMKAVRIARKSVPGMRITVAGGTNKAGYKAHLKRLAASLRVPVTFKGYVSRGGMPGFYRSGDCFVCPSQRHEAFGLVNVEAMASGLPCVASRNGGIPEIIRHHRNGLLVTAYRKPQAFADKLVKLARNSALSARLARQARKDAVSRFGWSGTAARLARLYAAKVR